MCHAAPTNPVSEHSRTQAEGCQLTGSLRLTPVNFQPQLKRVGTQGQPKGRAPRCCPASRARHGFCRSASLPDGVPGPPAHLSWHRGIAKLRSPRPYSRSIHTTYRHASHLQHTYFPVTSQSVMSILITMSCWNFAPSKNGPPHHIINSPSPNLPSMSAAYQSLPRPFLSPWTANDLFAG